MPQKVIILVYSKTVLSNAKLCAKSGALAVQKDGVRADIPAQQRA